MMSFFLPHPAAVSPVVTVSASSVIHIPGMDVTNVTCTATALPIPDVLFHNFTCMTGLTGEGEEGEDQM